MTFKIPRGEIYRKLVHTLGLLWIPFTAYDKSSAILTLTAAVLLYVTSYSLSKKGIDLPVVSWLTKRCRRNNDKDSLDWGPVTLALGIILSITIFPLHIARFGIIQVSLADALAGTLGYYGRHLLPHSKTKTYEGSFIFFVTAFGVSLAWTSWPAALILAFAGTLLETLPGRNIDNLTVPLGVNLLASLL